MNHRFVMFALVSAFVAVVGVSTASAQITTEVRFTTSFPFTAGTTRLPAGTYTVTGDALDPAMLEVKGSRASTFVLTNGASAKSVPSKSELVFQHYRKGYVLKDIWLGGSSTGYEVDTAHAAKHIAEAGETPGERRVAVHSAQKKHAKPSSGVK